MPRKLIVQTFVTLDGIMQAPGGPDEDADSGFDQGGWSVTYWDEAMGRIMGEATATPFAMVLGHRTFDIMAAHWPNAAPEDGADVFNNAPKYVASRGTANTDAWQNSAQIAGDAADGLRALKEEDGPELQVHGSANLIQSLLAAGIVDEFRMWIFPVVIGRGKRLFDDGTVPIGLELVRHEMSSTGVMIATYRPTGPIPIGSFALA